MAHSVPQPIVCANRASILLLTPTTTNEALLLATLREMDAENDMLRNRVVELQAANVLNEAYCKKLHFRLVAKEEKEKMKGKGKGKGKLMGDGLPRMLTSDEFYEKVVQFTEWQWQEDSQKEAHLDVKVAWKEAVKGWEAEELIRKEENNARKQRNKEVLKAWNDAKKAASKAKKQFTTPKPGSETLLPQPPKPRLKDFRAAVNGNDDGEVVDVGVVDSDDVDSDDEQS